MPFNLGQNIPLISAFRSTNKQVFLLVNDDMFVICLCMQSPKDVNFGFNFVSKEQRSQ